MRADPEFDDFVAAHSTALLRTAYLLTGDRGHAEDLLQTALIKTYLAWPRIRDAIGDAPPQEGTGAGPASKPAARRGDY